jgi:dethiobiotin synthetase
VLVGTGTGVGKTHVACALLRAWCAHGGDAVGLKPIETGVDAEGLSDRASNAAEPGFTEVTASSHERPLQGEGSEALRSASPIARVEQADFERLARAAANSSSRAVHVTLEASQLAEEGHPSAGPVAFHVKRPEDTAGEPAAFHVKRPEDTAGEPAAGTPAFHVKPPLYAFPDPVSPHLAAHRAGRRIDLAAVRHWVLEHSRTLTLVETAGGLFSPIDNSVTNLDLVRALLPARVLLVAPDRLGVLHDVTATIGFARASGCSITDLVLSAPDLADASTGHNESAIEALGLTRVLAYFPRADEAAASSRAAAEKVIEWLADSDGA